MQASPGEWKAVSDGVINEAGDCIAVTETDVNDTLTNYANARVMASGRRSLETLRRIAAFRVDPTNRDKTYSEALDEVCQMAEEVANELADISL